MATQTVKHTATTANRKVPASAKLQVGVEELALGLGVDVLPLGVRATRIELLDEQERRTHGLQVMGAMGTGMRLPTWHKKWSGSMVLTSKLFTITFLGKNDVGQ